jgi:Na+-driven multidrug efflux pump
MTIEEKKTLSVEFRRYLWSSILIALSGCLGNIVDGIIVGNLIGEDGVSAINLSKPVVQLMYTISMLLSTGAGMLVGYALGKGEKRHAKYIYTQSILGSMVTGVLFTLIAGILFPVQTARLLCDNEHLFPMAYDYLRVMMLGAPAYMLMWGLSTMVGVDGSPRLVSIAILIDNFVNLSLDIVFIKFFGWGIAGSSAATVVGHLVGIAIMFWHFHYKTHNIGLSFNKIEENGTTLQLSTEWRNIISQGAPLAVASVCLTLLLYVANTAVLSTAGRQGIFVFSVCMNLLQVYNLFLSGTCRTLQSLGAIQVGKKDEESYHFVLQKSFRFITISMAVTCLYVWLFPQSIAYLFGAETTEMVKACNHALRIFALSFVPFCYIYVIMIVYKLNNCHKMALFISFALSLTVIPVLWIVARFAPQYIWYSYLIAYLIEALAIFTIHKIGNLPKLGVMK